MQQFLKKLNQGYADEIISTVCVKGKLNGFILASRLPLAILLDKFPPLVGESYEPAYTGRIYQASKKLGDGGPLDEVVEAAWGRYVLLQLIEANRDNRDEDNIDDLF